HVCCTPARECWAARAICANCRRAASRRQSPTMSTFAPAGDFAAVALLGVDFTCSPSRRKPITVARGRVDGDRVVVDAGAAVPTLAALQQMLPAAGPWLGGFDLPFGLPRAFVDAHGLGSSAAEVIA